MVLLAGVLALILLGPELWTASPTDQNLMAVVQPPSGEHPLGTDQYGRDMLARLMDGGRVSLVSAVLIVAGSLMIGAAVGLLAAGKGLVARLVTHAIDMALALPSLILALVIVGALGIGMGNLILAFVAVGWPWYARLVRGIARERLSAPDILAARLAGVGSLAVMTGHVVPHLVARLAAAAALDLGYTLGALAGFSYLGLGAQAPAAEWGLMLRDAQMFFTAAPWLLIGPCTCIGSVVAAALLLAEDVAQTGGRT
ncbi:MAG: ABC transporter permease [Paracoccaceae bacterium]